MRARMALAALATMVATALSLATPAPALAIEQVSCTVPQWSCATPPLSTAIFHISTTGVTGPSFVVVRDLALPGQPEVVRENRASGNHEIWQSQVYSTYRAELHCPYACPGARIYFANG
jgi:hypothetical protein